MTQMCWLNLIDTYLTKQLSLLYPRALFKACIKTEFITLEKR